MLGNIGKCIYCGSKEDLTDEHVIPFGLNPRGVDNMFVLENASCKRCSNITSKFEYVQRYSLEVPRSFFNLKSRRNDLTNEFSIDIDNNGETKNTNIPIREFPTLVLPIYDLPSYMDNRTDNTLLVRGTVAYHIGGMSLEDLGKKYNTKKITFASRWRSHDFPRMLAKIAYGYSVANHGIDNIKEVYVLPAILGNKDDIGRWVGCPKENLITEKDLHIIKGYILDKEIMIRIKLFALYDMIPEYIVIVGRLKEEIL